MPWKFEVIADGSGKWCGNGRVFDTFDEAEKAAHRMAYAWVLVSATRIVPTDESVNAKENQ